MKYVSSYYKKQEEGAPGAVSLLLQHITWGKTPVCLACVCARETGTQSRYVVSQLLEWFYRTGIKYLAGGERDFRRAEAGLAKVLEKAREESKSGREAGRTGRSRAELSAGKIGSLQLSGILCVGCRFVLFYQGSQRIYGINTRFLKPHIKGLAGESADLQMESGILQPGIGVLLGTEAFFGHLTEELLRETLSQGALRTQMQADKHLKELGEGAENLSGAILICVR